MLAAPVISADIGTGFNLPGLSLGDIDGIVLQGDENPLVLSEISAIPEKPGRRCETFSNRFFEREQTILGHKLRVTLNLEEVNGGFSLNGNGVVAPPAFIRLANGNIWRIDAQAEDSIVKYTISSVGSTYAQNRVQKGVVFYYQESTEEESTGVDVNKREKIIGSAVFREDDCFIAQYCVITKKRNAFCLDVFASSDIYPLLPVTGD